MNKSSLSLSQRFFFFFFTHYASLSIFFIAGESAEKTVTDYLARPLTSADHKNSSQAGVEKTVGKASCGSQSIGQGYGEQPEPLDAFPLKMCLHPSADYFIPLLAAKVKKTELPCLRFNSLGGGDESKLRWLPLAFLPSFRPSARPGASSALQAPLQSSGKKKSGKREERVTR